MSLRQGHDIGAVNWDEAKAAGFALPADRIKPAPTSVAAPTLDVELTGAFPGRTSAEARALVLMKKAKIGVSMYAIQIKNHWCVVRNQHGVTRYVEG